MLEDEQILISSIVQRILVEFHYLKENYMEASLCIQFSGFTLAYVLVSKNVLQLLGIIAHEIIQSNSVSKNQFQHLKLHHCSYLSLLNLQHILIWAPQAQLTKRANFYIALHEDWNIPLCNGL